MNKTLRELAAEAESHTNVQEIVLNRVAGGETMTDLEFQKHVIAALVRQSRMIRDIARSANETGSA